MLGSLCSHGSTIELLSQQFVRIPFGSIHAFFLHIIFDLVYHVGADTGLCHKMHTLSAIDIAYIYLIIAVVLNMIVFCMLFIVAKSVCRSHSLSVPQSKPHKSLLWGLFTIKMYSFNVTASHALSHFSDELGQVTVKEQCNVVSHLRSAYTKRSLHSPVYLQNGPAIYERWMAYYTMHNLLRSPRIVLLPPSR